MSLSSSTLSLKFMQRGLARSSGAASTPSTPTTPRPSTASTAQATPTPVPVAGSSTSLPAAVIPREEEGRWFLPPRTASANANGAGDSSSSSQLVFESSYVPFLTPAQSTPRRNTKETGETTSGGGGRMTFGGFGKKPIEQKEGDELDEDEEVDDDEEKVRVKLEKGKGKSKTEPPTSSSRQDRTFQRPQLSPPPPPPPQQSSSSTPSKSQIDVPSDDRTGRSKFTKRPQQHQSPSSSSPSFSSQPRMSMAEKMRQTITSSRNSPSASQGTAVTNGAKGETPTSTATATPKQKKKRPSPSSAENEHGSLGESNKKVKVDSGKSMSSLDERERALKAQKKAEKKKRKEKNGS
ncbi:hypothetical protein IAR55_006841 [Kwoniella newhampshirensis]|uniref:Uncharacterized protein n=1 Tax=Kwoniella newhampshirensis TaxID=1651941 RepID=A0AAW0YWM1_9TREE